MEVMPKLISNLIFRDLQCLISSSHVVADQAQMVVQVSVAIVLVEVNQVFKQQSIKSALVRVGLKSN